MRCLAWLVALGLGLGAPGRGAAESDVGTVLRDRATLIVGGARETWELRWRGKPELACVGEELATCLCSGFAVAEAGDLVLVRRRDDAVVETMELTPLFLDPDNRGGPLDKAVLQRWKPAPGDETRSAEQLRPLFARRGETHPLAFRDLDHDGLASEFLLQIDTAPCGKRIALAIGLDPNGRLHALRAADEPKAPLLLDRRVWDRLAERPEVSIVTLPCGDHASDREVTTHARAVKGTIRVSETPRPCGPSE